MPFRAHVSVVVALVFASVAPIADASAQNASPWAGPYVGAMIGVQSTRDKDQLLYHFDPTTRIQSSAIAGYNWSNGSIVYGLEGEIGKAEDERVWGFVRGRVGLSLGPAMVYAGLGYGWVADRELRAPYRPPGSFELDVFGSQADMQASEFSLGSEIRLSPHISLRAEVVRSNFEREGATVPRADLGGPQTLPQTHLRDTTARIGIAYYLAGSREAAPRDRAGWVGPSIGLRGGVVLRDHSIKESSADLAEFPNDVGRLQFAAIGLSAGYLWQMGSFVVGPEIRLDQLEGGESAMSGVVRLGIAWNQSLLYALGGFARTTSSATDLRGDERQSAKHDGLTYGVGIETRLSKPFSLRIEATRVDGGQGTYSYSGFFAPGRPSRLIGSPPRDASVSDTAVTLGLSWRFEQ